jgi:hypothetical protein
MITNFEEITKELTETEMQVLEPLKDVLSKTNNKNPYLTETILWHLSEYKITGVRLRKLVNYIRVNRLLPLIATSKGYYLSWDNEDIKKEVKSLRERANSINNAADGLESFLNPQMEMYL